MQTMTSGWVVKKYMGSRKEDQRFIVLQDKKLKYYDRDPSTAVQFYSTGSEFIDLI